MLRERDGEAPTRSASTDMGTLRFKNIVADVRTLIFDPNLHNGVFQVCRHPTGNLNGMALLLTHKIRLSHHVFSVSNVAAGVAAKSQATHFL